jgi:Tol biopolymer transport system component
VFKTLAVGFSIFFLIAFGKCVRVSSGHMEAVSVSPDGKLLSGVYGYQDEHGVFIYKIAVETGVATRLTEAKSGWESSPTFSADWKQIAFSYESGNGEQPGS